MRYVCDMRTIDDEVKTNFENDKHRFITNLIFTSNWFSNQWANFLKPYGISNQQMNVLRILRGAKDWKTMNDIKSLMVDKTPNTTRLSDKLLEKGFVERKRSEEDRRVVYLKITATGLALLSEIDKADTSELMKFMEVLTDEEAKKFSHLLDQIRN